MNEQRPRDVFQVFDPVEPPPVVRRCAWRGCAADGVHRAPVSRAKLAEYHWFCLDHVRIYNASWNYYEGLSDAEMEAHLRSDMTWNRPTWPLGDGPAGKTGGADAAAHLFDGLNDPFGFMDGHSGGTRGTAQKPSTLSATEQKAFVVLDLDFPVTFEEVRAQYKALVKRHHPDANGGAKDAEERLKRINEAYETLKNGFFA